MDSSAATWIGIVVTIIAIVLSIGTLSWKIITQRLPKIINVYSGFLLRQGDIIIATGSNNKQMYLVANNGYRYYIVIAKFARTEKVYQAFLRFPSHATYKQEIFLYAVSTALELRPGSQLSSLNGLKTSPGVWIRIV